VSCHSAALSEGGVGDACTCSDAIHRSDCLWQSWMSALLTFGDVWKVMTFCGPCKLGGLKCKLEGASLGGA